MSPAARLTAMRALPLALLLVASTASAQVVTVGTKAPELDVAVDANGKSFKLKSVDGWKVVTVGAEWCKPCKKELTAWDKLAGQKAKKVTFVAVDIDEDIDDGKRFHKDLKLKNMVRVYLPQNKSAVVNRYGADTMPTTVIIDPSGVVRHVHKGFDGDDDVKKLADAIDKLNP